MSVAERLPDAVGRAAGLRERLVRVGYGLHYAASSVATLMDELAGREPLTAQLDYQAEADRWRGMSAQALATARSRERGPEPRLVPRESAPPTAIGPEDVDELADSAVRQLFLSGMRLQSIAPLTSGTVRDRVEEAVDCLDEVIRTVRTIIFAAHPDDG